MNVVLITPSGAAEVAVERLGLSGGADDVTIVSASPADAAAGGKLSHLRLPEAMPGSSGLARRLRRSAIGRNLIRLSPWDDGRRLAAAARRSDRFRTAAAEADLIVALDRDAILTAWTAARRWARPDAHVVFGAAPAEALRNAARDDASG